MARQQIVLRVPSELNRAVRKAARTSGISINAFIAKVLGNSAGVKTARAGKATRGSKS
jgi:predicted HicB family RNase H-like nuclease